MNLIQMMLNIVKYKVNTHSFQGFSIYVTNIPFVNIKQTAYHGTATYVNKMPILRLIYYNLMDATNLYISFIYLILKCKSQYKYMLLNHAQMR